MKKKSLEPIERERTNYHYDKKLLGILRKLAKDGLIPSVTHFVNEAAWQKLKREYELGE